MWSFINTSASGTGYIHYILSILVPGIFIYENKNSFSFQVSPFHGSLFGMFLALIH